MAIAYGDEIATLDALPQVREVNGMCPFLLANGMCSIYDNRPLNCRIYPHGINPHCINNEGHVKGDSRAMNKLFNERVGQNPIKKVYV